MKDGFQKLKIGTKSGDIASMLTLKGNEKVKEETGTKILNPNKLFTRLPVLLAQIKAGNNS